MSNALKPNDFWQTPQYIWAVINEFNNHQTVDMAPISTLEDGYTLDSLAIPWPATAKCYINPPFSQYLAWAKHGVKQGGEQIWMCNHDHSTERLTILLRRATAVCLLTKRVAFIDPATGQAAKGNNTCQSLVYIPSQRNRTSEFNDTFRRLGICLEVAR